MNRGQLPRWTHATCTMCFAELRLNEIALWWGLVDEEDRNDEHCCYCAIVTRSGLYMRYDPLVTPCGGLGPTHQVKEETRS